MKNLINYYYNLIPAEIHQKDDVFDLLINNNKYIFMPYYGSINNLNIIYNYLINLNIYCHEIIYNKENSIITFNKNEPYILLRVYYHNYNIISMQDITSYNVFVKNNQRCNWKKLWCEKIDYYEYQIKEFGKKYPLIRDSFSYYDGLCETAISLLNLVDINNVNTYINHQRIKKNMRSIDFYNPLNLIIDVKIRDISDYFKINFFEKNNIINEVHNYLYNTKLNYNELLLFFIRLIYPSYYFDMYDKILQGKEKEEKIKFYLNKSTDYELFLKNVYMIINKYYKLPEIEWIIKT